MPICFHVLWMNMETSTTASKSSNLPHLDSRFRVKDVCERQQELVWQLVAGKRP